MRAHCAVLEVEKISWILPLLNFSPYIWRYLGVIHGREREYSKSGNLVCSSDFFFLATWILLAESDLSVAVGARSLRLSCPDTSSQFSFLIDGIVTVNLWCSRSLELIFQWRCRISQTSWFVCWDRDFGMFTFESGSSNLMGQLNFPELRGSSASTAGLGCNNSLSYSLPYQVN